MLLPGGHIRVGKAYMVSVDPINLIPRRRRLGAGDIIYIYAFGNPIIILNSAKAANDLLDKRSAKYSSRPVCLMVQEL